eukprot:TRINITY_DN18323_c0_g1_i1.p1 TRINITY_DN18323_c0_g1~~TRINITY_DN18323_c0_g1_i1.p1  ORF type:complete len:470 (-),score=64.42 TRINITY_DN18323_c0_g1_i1:69-1478(-)
MSMESERVSYSHFDVHRHVDKSPPAARLPDPEGAHAVVDYRNVEYPAVTGEAYDALPTYPPRAHFNQHHIKMRPSTQLVVFDGCPNDPYHPTSMPIYQTATFVQPTATTFGPYDYTRSGNPTRTALETIVSGLENAYAAFAFASGMAALSSVTRLVKAGEEIIASSDLYGGMYRLLTKVCSRLGIVTKFVDTSILNEVLQALTPKTRLVFVESPSNPLMKISDITGIGVGIKKYNPQIIYAIDSSMMTSLLQRPLDLGVDIVIHSGTKFFGGHSDTTVGIVCVNNEALAKEIAFFQNAEGTGLAPFECWLVLRGMKTMSLRLEKSQENALKVVKFLSSHPLVTACYYPGYYYDKNNDQKRDFETEIELHKKQSRGGGSLLSFDTGNTEISRQFINALKLFKITVSFGSTNSLVEMPCLLSHASIPAEKRTLPESLVRMSIGIEHVQDILNDIKQALDSVSLKYKNTSKL